VANIGPRGVRRRRIGGVVWLVIGVAAAGWMVARVVPGAAYVLLAIPFTMAALGFLQARERT
jgi:hypothetical protein